MQALQDPFGSAIVQPYIHANQLSNLNTIYSTICATFCCSTADTDKPAGVRPHHSTICAPALLTYLTAIMSTITPTFSTAFLYTLNTT